jgi:hypothetical protein
MERLAVEPREVGASDEANSGEELPRRSER